MKNIFSIILLLLVAVSYGQLDRSKLPTPATPRAIEIGDYESFELKNGLKIFIIENHKLPRVSYNLVLDREPILEGDKAGYLGMVGQMMRRGTDTRTKEQIDEEIDFIGASLGAGSTNVFASGLSKYNEKVLELMTDVAFNAIFPEEELEKIRKQTISGLAANKEDPGAIASNLNQKLLYGADHPYGEIQTEETTNNITVDDLKGYHAAYFRPNIAYLAIVGDVNPKAMKKLVKTYFGSWERGEVEKPVYEMPAAPEKNAVGIVSRSSAVQSTINITYPVDLQIGSEDVIKARVMNQILGGSGSAKLFMNLREDKGFTYGSYSSLSSDELVGRFNASAEVRNEVTDSSIVQIFYEMEQMQKGEIKDEEMTLAKNSIAGSFSRSLEQPQTVANFALNTARYNYPADYYATYLQKVQAVSKEDIQAMANKYLKRENAYINVVGKGDEIAEQLKQFGELKYYDTYGNEVDPSMAKLPAGLTVESVLEKYKEALGGDAVINKIENVTMKMSASTMGQTLSVEQIQSKGLKSKTAVSMGPMVVMSSISDGTNAAVAQMGNKMPLDDATTEEQIITNSLFAELYLKESGAELSLSGVEKIDGKDAYGIGVKLPKGSTFTVYFYADSGLKARYYKVIESPQGSMISSVDYMDYREFEGSMFAYKINQKAGPQSIGMEVQEIQINQDLPADTFKVE